MKHPVQFLVCFLCFHVFQTAQAQYTRLAASSGNDRYQVEVKTAGAFTPGKPDKMEITLTCKGEFHINAKYPVKFTPAEPQTPEIKVPKPVPIQKGPSSHKKAVFYIPFTMPVAGTSYYSGTLEFGLINGSQQSVEKAEIKFEAEAK